VVGPGRAATVPKEVPMNTPASTTNVRTTTLIAAIALAGVLTACERTPEPPASAPADTSRAEGNAPPTDLGPGSDASPPPSSAAQTAAPSPEDNSFVTAAAAGGRAEAEAGRLMAGRAADPQVRAFAEMLDKEHTAANTELERIAGAHGIPLPQGMAPASREHIEELKTLTGAEADAAFLRHFGTAAHEDTIALFERQAKSGQVPELRSFAADTAPKLREHLRLARQLEERLATDGGTR